MLILAEQHISDGINIVVRHHVFNDYGRLSLFFLKINVVKTTLSEFK